MLDGVDALEAAHEAGYDPVLYRARRDLVPPRRLERSGVCIHLDHVDYEVGDLPSGEPFRSIGHWNPDDEWEVFQVVEGAVALLCATRDLATFVHRLDAGSSLALPPAMWHLTYPLAPRSRVVNIYPRRLDAAPVVGAGKYATRSPGGPCVRPTRRELETAPSPPAHGVDEDLVELLLRGSDEQLLRLDERLRGVAVR